MTTFDILLAQFGASTAMAAIVWFVQVVHYPLFARVGDDSSDYHEENVRRTRPVVLVPMAAEAATAVWVALAPPAAIGRGPALAGLALLAVAILSTALVQVPLHARLRSGGPDLATVRALVTSNWIRTAAWSLRAGLAAWMVRAVVAGG